MGTNTIDGVIVVDSTGRPIVQSNFRHGVSYPLVHIDALVAASNHQATEHVDIDPVLSVATPTGSAICCHVEHGGLRFLCPVSEQVDPTFVFAFIDTFIQVLKEYLGTLSVATLQDNFDIVHQLLEEMLDDGHPLTTESNTLKDIVLPPSIINKILSVAGVSGGLAAVGPAPAPFSSPIPWRRSGVKYTSNEIYFDIEETSDAIVSANGSTLSSDTWGKITCNCRLSGTPDLLLTLKNKNLITDPSFHASVRLHKFASQKDLSFVPPDGNFTLMDYGLVQGQPPQHQIQLKPSVDTSKNGGTFKFALSSRTSPTKPLASVVLTYNFGKFATGVVCSTSLSVPPGPRNEGRESSWGWDIKTQQLRWEIPALSSATAHTIQGTFTSTDLHPRPARSVTTTYKVPSSPQSTIIKVDQLKLAGGEVYKPFKGVRLTGAGKIEWRL